MSGMTGFSFDFDQPVAGLDCIAGGVILCLNEWVFGVSLRLDCMHAWVYGVMLYNNAFYIL